MVSELDCSSAIVAGGVGVAGIKGLTDAIMA